MHRSRRRTGPRRRSSRSGPDSSGTASDTDRRRASCGSDYEIPYRDQTKVRNERHRRRTTSRGDQPRKSLHLVDSRCFRTRPHLCAVSLPSVGMSCAGSGARRIPNGPTGGRRRAGLGALRGGSRRAVIGLAARCSSLDGRFWQISDSADQGEMARLPANARNHSIRKSNNWRARRDSNPRPPGS